MKKKNKMPTSMYDWRSCAPNDHPQSEDTEGLRSLSRRTGLEKAEKVTPGWRTKKQEMWKGSQETNV